jgi:hypothetical protein
MASKKWYQIPFFTLHHLAARRMPESAVPQKSICDPIAQPGIGRVGARRTMLQQMVGEVCANIYSGSLISS